MKIYYYIDDDRLFEDDVDESTPVPSSGDMVFLEEILFVDSVVWYPREKQIRVNLSESKPFDKPLVKESKNVVDLAEIRQIKVTAEKALKESNTMKKEISGIRQFLKTQNRNTNNDIR